MTAWALEIKDLKKQYRNGVEALKGIDLKVPKGSFFGLLGPNGAGKSTTISIISTLLSPSSGQVSILGVDVATDRDLAKTYLGLVPQEFNFNQFEKVSDILFNQAGYYGISRAQAKERVMYYLRKLGLYEKRHAISRSLSGGMKRRLMIARALVHEPQILILDEPTAGVDIEIRRDMWAFLSELNAAGVTIILTTHYLEEAEQLCQQLAIIDKGQIIEHTSMKALLVKLDQETVILDLANPLTEQPPKMPGFDCVKRDDLTLEVRFKKTVSLNDLFLALDACGIRVLSLRNKSNRLEELFLQLVKKKDQ